MQKAVFDELTVLYRAHESRTGCAELCQDTTGTKRIRVRICSPPLQKELLTQLAPSIPVRLSSGILDLLLPWQEGQTLAEWLYAVQPGLGQRRDACLSLLAELIAFPVAPCLTALSAETENLCFAAQHCHLRRLPRLSHWHLGIQEPAMVRAAALLVRQILTEGQSKSSRHRFPMELQLILQRCDLGDYTRWESLQQDLAALPDALYPASRLLQRLRTRLQRTVMRHIPAAIRVIVALLAAAALVSLASALRTWHNEQKNTWPGMTQVGDQVLHQQEEGEQ